MKFVKIGLLQFVFATAILATTHAWGVNCSDLGDYTGYQNCLSGYSGVCCNRLITEERGDSPQCPTGCYMEENPDNNGIVWCSKLPKETISLTKHWTKVETYGITPASTGTVTTECWHRGCAEDVSWGTTKCKEHQTGTGSNGTTYIDVSVCMW